MSAYSNEQARLAFAEKFADYSKIKRQDILMLVAYLIKKPYKGGCFIGTLMPEYKELLEKKLKTIKKRG